MNSGKVGELWSQWYAKKMAWWIYEGKMRCYSSPASWTVYWSFKILSSARAPFWDFLSVFTVELYVILMALEWAEQIKASKELMCTGSISALYSIKCSLSSSHQDFLYEIIMKHSWVTWLATEVTLPWVPAHATIVGDERVDCLAQSPISGSPSSRERAGYPPHPPTEPTHPPEDHKTEWQQH